MAPIQDLRMSQGFHDVLSRSHVGEEEVETGEEFAPTEDLDEIRPRRQKRKASGAAARPKSFGDDISDTQLFFWCIVVILAAFYCMFWRQEKFTVGFCGVPQSERTCPFHNVNPSINGRSRERALSE
jgi:hypothetical protein